MREPYYENQGANTYLVYGIGPEDELDTMSLGMLTNNKIPGFAVASFTQMDAEKFIKYNVSSKVSAAQLFSGPVNKKRLIGVLSGIVNAMLSAEEYMIDPATILLDMDYIFMDVSTCETVLICLPVLQENSHAADMGMFFKNLIFRTQFDQTENSDHVVQILNYLNTAPILSLMDFKDVLDKLSGVAPKAPVQPAPQPEKPAQPSQTYQPAVQTYQPAVPAQTYQPAAPQPAMSVQQMVNANAKAAPQPAVKPAAKPVPQKPAPAPAPAGFAIPGQKPVTPAQKPAATPAAAPEKEISFMYLMQHYNKENAAAYKAQQDAKKAQKGAAAPAKPEKKGKPDKKNTPPAPAGFPVPGGIPVPNGQQPKPGFPVPGQKPVMPPVQPKPAPQPVAKPMPQPTVQPTVMQQPQATVMPPVQQPVIPAAPQNFGGMNFGETTVLGGGGVGETTVLGAVSANEPQVRPHLIRTKNNERIYLDKPVFRIGKEKSYVDYFIGDNTAISRSHANIVSRDGEYFVVDTNSTNHTYVNGGMIQSNVETKISHDTKIRLANEDFTFKLY